jgi:hypothetical protein
MKQKNINQELIGILQQLQGEAFTVGQVLELYMANPLKNHTDLKLARQFIHRNMLRLIATGDLIKISVTGRRYKYLTTEQFISPISPVRPTSVVPEINETARTLALEKNLTERLNHQKLKLLTAMGEAEEYDSIYKEMPEMRTQIQELYNESRDRCSKLLGRVKAIENLITISVQ